MRSKNKNIVIIAGSILLGLLLGWIFFAGGNGAEAEHVHVDTEEGETIWTCSMHPQIRQTEPGDCPICGMDLIPLENEEIEGDVLGVRMSENALRLANVQTTRVGGQDQTKEIRLNGRVAVDERRVSAQTSHIPGRIENLLVNFTGETVSRGQPLARVYSPQLVTAQEELLQAYAMRSSQPELYEAARQKLRNWRIGENQINRIIESGEASDRFTITADAGGVVTEKLVNVGDYVERGAPIYQIADLSKVWVLFDVYENNMSWIQEGSKVEFTIASIPGETFTGTVQFIDPTLGDNTRVSTARVEVDNPNGSLKPGMFATGLVENPLEGTSFEIAVPKSAVLWTGRRSVVYVLEEADGRPFFMLRQVVLGPSLGDSYVINEGLEMGEEVVVNGAFTIDAAAQLAGKPSMMSPEMEPEVNTTEREDIRMFLQHNTGQFEDELPGEVQEQLREVLNIYLDLKAALVESNPDRSRSVAKRLYGEVQGVSAESFSGEAAEFLERRQQQLENAVDRFGSSGDLQEQREAFVDLSEEMVKITAAFGLREEIVYVDYCPMANSDRGAFWLSEIEEIRNPYYGEAMLTCGEIVAEIE